MTLEAKHRGSGTPMSVWIAQMPAAMENVGIDLRDIVADGLGGYGLHGSALVDFVRQCLHSLVRAGAVRWRWVEDRGRGHWEIETKYGTDPNAVVEGVIAEWLAGKEMPDIFVFWFGTPAMLEARKERDVAR